MRMIDPTYLRIINDGLLSGTIHKDNASALPIGLVGMYEEALPPASNLNERRKFLEFFAVWALLKEGVTISFVASVMKGWTEVKVLDYMTFWSKWFNQVAPGKFQIYHERFCLFILQKLSKKQIREINQGIAEHLTNDYISSSNNEVQLYSLRFLSHHWLIHFNLTGEIRPLLELANDDLYRDKQVEFGKGYFWTVKTLQDGINASLLKNNNSDTLKLVVKYLSAESNMVSNLDMLFQNLQNGEFENSNRTLTYIRKNQSSRFDLTINYILCSAIIELDMMKRTSMLIGIQSFIESVDEEIVIDSLPDLIKFEIAYLSFKENLGFDYLYRKSLLGVDGEMMVVSKKQKIDIEKYKDFVVYLLEEKIELISNEFIDTVLFSALKKEDDSFVQMLLGRGFEDFSLQTIEQLAFKYFRDENQSEFVKILDKLDECFFNSDGLFKEICNFSGFEKALKFFLEIPNKRLSLLLLEQLEKVVFLNAELDRAQIVIDIFEERQREENIEGLDIDSIISKSRLKKSILLNPEIVFDSKGINIQTLDNFITTLSAIREQDKHILRLFRISNIPLFKLSDTSIYAVTFALGREVLIEEYFSEYRKELSEKSSRFFNQIKLDLISAVHFIRGLPMDSMESFQSSITELLDFLTGPEYSIASELINQSLNRTRKVYFIFQNLIEFQNYDKAKVFYKIFQSDFKKRYLDDFGKEELRLHLDLNFRGKKLENAVDNKIKTHLSIVTIPWDSDYHMAKISEEFLENGEFKLAFDLLKDCHPSRWHFFKVKSFIEWQKITNKFLRFYLKEDDLAGAIELYSHCIEPLENGSKGAEMLHEIALKFKSIDDKSRELIINKIVSNVNILDKIYSDTITRAVSNKLFYSGLILLAEVYFEFGLIEESKETYARIFEAPNSLKNSSDFDIILCNLCRSIVSRKLVGFYNDIIKNIYINGSFVIQFNVHGWIDVLGNCRNELSLLGDSENITIIDDAINKFSLAGVASTEQSNELVVANVTEKNFFYLRPFNDYRMALYDASGEQMLNALIRYSAYKCFSANKDLESLNAISEVINLNRWKAKVWLIESGL
jgi:hypothetical protein